MLEYLLGSISRERVLLFLYSRAEGYPREIARFFKTDLDPIQKQLEKLETGGILYSRNAGKTRLYALNPGYPFLNELKALLERALSFYPQEERERLVINKSRPGRKVKPSQKPISEMSLGELAAFVCSYLMKNGTNVVLSGGGCVTIYTKNVYQSCNLDFVENITSGRKRLKKLMSEIGFVEDNKLFKNPENELYIKFPPGPLCIGKEPVRDIVTMEFSTGRLKLLSPTDCVKDRLASYYRWNDKQCLEQAIIVSENIKIDISEIDRWSAQEGKGKEFSSIESMIKDAQKKHSEF